MASVIFVTTVILLLQPISGLNFDSYDFKMYLDRANTYLIAWTVDPTKTNITIAVSVPTTGWASIGLSPTGLMPLSDIALFWVDDIQGTVWLQDRYTTSYREQPLLDTNQNLILLEGEQLNGKTNIVFQRAVNPCDANINSQDYPIVVGTSKVIIAWSEDNSDPVFTNLSEITFNYHGQNKASASVNLLHGTNLDIELDSNVQTFDVVVHNYHIPAKKTKYYEQLFTLPVNGNEKYHIVKFEPIITAGNEIYVHHMILYYCAVGSKCNTVVYGNAIATHSLTFPENIGLEMSKEYLYRVKLQIHYNNPDVIGDVYDSSGIKIYYTSALRQHTAGLIEFGIDVDDGQFIPPAMSNALNTAYCAAKCLNAIPSGGVYAFNSWLHAHKLGVAIQIKHIRNGKELHPISSNLAYDSKYQQYLPLLQHVKILPGDELQINCLYDSSLETKITYGGISSKREMCQAYLYVYPRPKLRQCKSKFTQEHMETFWKLATAAKYATGSTKKNRTYNLKGDPYTYTLNNSSITIQNGEELYNYLWTGTDIPELSKRYQYCKDIGGHNILSNEMDIPNGYTPYISNVECKDVQGSVRQVGKYSVPDDVVTENTNSNVIIHWNAFGDNNLWYYSLDSMVLLWMIGLGVSMACYSNCKHTPMQNVQ